MNTTRSLALLLACTLPSLAALPLTAIKEYQESVPEFIDLQVTKVIKTPVKQERQSLLRSQSRGQGSPQQSRSGEGLDHRDHLQPTKHAQVAGARRLGRKSEEGELRSLAQGWQGGCQGPSACRSLGLFRSEIESRKRLASPLHLPPHGRSYANSSKISPSLRLEPPVGNPASRVDAMSSFFRSWSARIFSSTVLRVISL